MRTWTVGQRWNATSKKCTAWFAMKSRWNTVRLNCCDKCQPIPWLDAMQQQAWQENPRVHQGLRYNALRKTWPPLNGWVYAALLLATYPVGFHDWQHISYCSRVFSICTPLLFDRLRGSDDINAVCHSNSLTKATFQSWLSSWTADLICVALNLCENLKFTYRNWPCRNAYPYRWMILLGAWLYGGDCSIDNVQAYDSKVEEAQ